MNDNDKASDASKKGDAYRQPSTEEGRRRDPQSRDYWPRELDPAKHPPGLSRPIEHEKGRPRDTGRGGA